MEVWKSLMGSLFFLLSRICDFTYVMNKPKVVRHWSPCQDFSQEGFPWISWKLMYHCVCVDQVVLHMAQTTEFAPSPITQELGLSTTKAQPAREVSRMKMTSSQTSVVYSHHRGVRVLNRLGNSIKINGSCPRYLFLL